MAKFKKYPAKPKKPNTTKSSLETLESFPKKMAEYKKKCTAVDSYNNKLKKAREKVKNA